MKRIHIYALSGALMTTAAATAQNLSTEVVVERTVQPTELAATRPAGLTPVLISPAVSPVTLRSADYSALSPVARSIATLSPASGNLIPGRSNQRGYVSIGYFPVYNLGISAGYRAIDSEKTILDIWAQFDGESYKDYSDLDYKDSYNGGRLGAWLSHRFNSRSTLDVALAYHYASSRDLWRDNQSLNNFALDARWSSQAGNVSYNVGAKAVIDGYGDTKAINEYINTTGFDVENGWDMNGVSQQMFGISGGASVPFADVMRAGIDVDAEFLHSSDATFPLPGVTLKQDASTLGNISLTPYYRLGTSAVEARVGVKVDIATSSLGGDVLPGLEEQDAKTFHVAPDVLLAWHPTSMFTGQLTFGGGDVLNPLYELRQVSAYIPGWLNYDRSNIPVTAELRLRFGPFKGFSAEVFGAYAKADDWLMLNAGGDRQPFMPTDVKGYNLGIALDYTSRLFDVNASVQFAPNDMDKAWYLNRDRAKYVINAGADVRPIERLTVGLGYEFRGGRNMGYGFGGCVSDLQVRAGYRFNDMVGVFARVENILGRRYYILPTLRNAPVHGLVGVNLTF